MATWAVALAPRGPGSGARESRSMWMRVVRPFSTTTSGTSARRSPKLAVSRYRPGGSVRWNSPAAPLWSTARRASAAMASIAAKATGSPVATSRTAPARVPA